MQGETWKIGDSVSQLYRIQQARTHTPYAQVADKMIDLINELQADERFHYVKVASAGMGMQLGIPGSKGSVYIEWHFPLKRFQIGVNLHEPSYKTEFEGVDDEEIVTKSMKNYKL